MEKKTKRQIELVIGICLVLFALEQWVSPLVMPDVATLAGWLIFRVCLVRQQLIRQIYKSN